MAATMDRRQFLKESGRGIVVASIFGPAIVLSPAEARDRSRAAGAAEGEVAAVPTWQRLDDIQRRLDQRYDLDAPTLVRVRGDLKPPLADF